ncbi:hypothetical protein HA402_004781 [Bradysia odoriphaga]|nr:hypothetical protein HA402_004781 [Bradysia odoriphaga]
MNWIIWTIWILISPLLLMKKTTATPLMNFAGNKIGGNNKMQAYTGVRFRDEDYDASGFDPSEDVHKCAKGSTFCEKIENYPSTEVTSILSETNKYSELFGSDSVNTMTIGNRFGEEDDEEQLCASQIRLVYPQAGLTRDNTWRYIVNQQNYTQGIRVDECVHTRQCNMMHQLPFGLKSHCKQKYVYRQLVAIDEDGNTVKDLFKIPSCCTCVLIRTHGRF